MINGIDVSDWQFMRNGVVDLSLVDFTAVHNAGAAFVIAKATEGANGVQITFSHCWSAIAGAGLARAAYHYAFPDANSADQEAAWFVSHVSGLATGDVLVLDIEEGTGDLSAWALQWLQAVQQQTGVKPWVYASTGFINAHLTGAALGNYPLWVAEYHEPRSPASPPQTPVGPWNLISCWQWTEKGSVAGITPVDQDVFYGDLGQWQNLGKPAPLAARHWQLTVAMHFRPQPDVNAGPWGAELPAGTQVVEVSPPGGSASEQRGFAYCRTSGDVRGWLLMTNMAIAHTQN